MDRRSLIPSAGDGQPVTMSSLEIAELVESRHDKVKQSIERLAERGVIQLPPMGEVENKQSLSPNSKSKAYIFSGEQGRRDSIVVVAQLSPEFTARLVDRWQELEEAIRNPFAAMIPQDYPSALRALADSTEKVHALEAVNAELAPKADALDLISASEGSLTFTQAAKLVGVKRETLTRCMHVDGWIYRQNGSWVAYAQHIKNGRLEYKEANYTDQKTGMRCARPYCHITPKGLAKLAVILGPQGGTA